MNNQETSYEDCKISILPNFQLLIYQKQKENNALININKAPSKFLTITPNKNEKEDVESEHSAEPIKDLSLIKDIRDYLLMNKQYRDLMLFIVGINIGLRVSDLIKLKFSDVINEEGNFKEDVSIVVEKKTNKKRKFALNNAAKQVIGLYLKHTSNVNLDDYMFKNLSSNRLKSKIEINIEELNEEEEYIVKYKNGKPYYYKEVDYMTRQSVQRVLNKIFDDLDINLRHGTHILRKTFAYHVLMKGGSFAGERALQKLQMLLNHSSPEITLRYAGITDEEIYKTYTELDFGLDLFDIEL